MILNFNLIIEMGLTPDDIVFLQACHQNTGDLDTYIRSSGPRCSHRITPDLLTKTKAGSIRLSKEGRALVKKLHSPALSENDGLISDYLLAVYKQDGDKILCSKPKLTSLVAWLRTMLGMTHKQFLKLIELYFEDQEASRFNKRVDYLIYKPLSNYNGAISLKNGESRLYEYYITNKEDIDKTLTNI